MSGGKTKLLVCHFKNKKEIILFLVLEDPVDLHLFFLLVCLLSIFPALFACCFTVGPCFPHKQTLSRYGFE